MYEKIIRISYRFSASGELKTHVWPDVQYHFARKVFDAIHVLYEAGIIEGLVFEVTERKSDQTR